MCGKLDLLRVFLTKSQKVCSMPCVLLATTCYATTTGYALRPADRAYRYTYIHIRIEDTRPPDAHCHPPSRVSNAFTNGNAIYYICTYTVYMQYACAPQRLGKRQPQQYSNMPQSAINGARVIAGRIRIRIKRRGRMTGLCAVAAQAAFASPPPYGL